MAAPFVSRDGADKDGVRAEVYVQKGTGTITAIENKDDEGQKNVQVQIKSDLAQVKRPIKGWLAKNDPIYPEVLAAADSRRVVEYRVEAQRKKKIDRSIPIADLRKDAETAGENTLSIFAGLDGKLSREAVTHPDEDPGEGGRIPATGQPSTPSAPAPAQTGPMFDKDAALTALATARATGMDETVVGAAAAFALMAGATPKQVKEAGFQEQAQRARSQVQRSFAAEAPPHAVTNSDGRFNLGSYQVQAAFGAESFAKSLLADLNREAFEAHNAAAEAGETDENDLPFIPMVEPEPVDLNLAATMADVLLKLADRIQIGTYGQGARINRMANSHTRARNLVFDTVRERHPWPWGVSAEEANEWMDTVVSECVERFQRLTQISQNLAEQPTEPSPAQEKAETPASQPQPTPEQTTSAPARQQTSTTPDARAAAPAPQTEHPAPAAAATEEQPVVEPKVEGDPGFIEPTEEVKERFKALVAAAGLEPTPGGPLSAFLTKTYGVVQIRKIHGPRLAKTLAWFEAKGDDAGPLFHDQVLKVAGVQPQPA